MSGTSVCPLFVVFVYSSDSESVSTSSNHSGLVMDIEGTDERECGEDQVAGSLTCCAQDFEWKSAVLPLRLNLVVTDL